MINTDAPIDAVVDVIVVGGGIAGMATAMRLQAAGVKTMVLEAHGQPGGCAGFYRRKGFSFDVGATTLVDFEPGGVGGELLESVGMSLELGELLPGYVAWLPDRAVTLYRDSDRWHCERLRAFGDTPAHRRLWNLLDRLARVFWKASRSGVELPITRAGQLVRAARAVGVSGWPLARYLRWTMADALAAHGLCDDKPLVGLLSMLIEDTVHSTIERAPLINSALGITIRGAGLIRARGGMRGFWRKLVAHYRATGGVLRVGCRVDRVTANDGSFAVHTRRGVFNAGQVVSALPIQVTAAIGPQPVREALDRYITRDDPHLGGAIVVLLGVPESEVADQRYTHHQLLQDYDVPLGNGNNMFISVSAKGDIDSAPAGHRAVMISTHCDLEPWRDLGATEYRARKRETETRLIELARRGIPQLGAGRRGVRDRHAGDLRALHRPPERRGRRGPANSRQQQSARGSPPYRSAGFLAGRRYHLARARHRGLRFGQPHRGPQRPGITGQKTGIQTTQEDDPWRATNHLIRGFRPSTRSVTTCSKPARGSDTGRWPVLSPA